MNIGSILRRLVSGFGRRRTMGPTRRRGGAKGMATSGIARKLSRKL